MRAECGESALSQCALFGFGGQKSKKCLSDDAGLRDSQSVSFAKLLNDVAKVFRKGANHDRFGKLRRLKDVVAAARHQTAADKGDAGQAVERSQFADAVEQKYRARERLPGPSATPPKRDMASAQQLRSFSEALRVARGQDHDRIGMLAQHLLPGVEQE